MDDLISRAELIDDLAEKGFYPAIVRRAIEKAPSVDAVEVVRCKDCKFHHWEQEPCHGKTVHFCNKLDAEVTSEFYCAAGGKKDEHT